tara:strand:+ start:388 stop:564 length:177 start_codon:yes stop_codon:yes gene_type:complete
MIDLTIVLGAVTMLLWGFLMGVCYVTIKNMSEKLAFFERREAFISDLVDRKMQGEEDE